MNTLRKPPSQPKATSHEQSVLAKVDRDKKTIDKKAKKVNKTKA